MKSRAFSIFLILGWALQGCSLQGAKKNYILAEKLWVERKYTEAVSEFDKVYKKDPKGKLGVQALYRSAMTQTLFLNEHGEAYEKLRHFLEVAPQSPVAWSVEKEMGEILFNRLKSYHEAILHYQQMLDKGARRSEADSDEDFPFLYRYRIAQAHFSTFELDEALKGYQAIAADPEAGTWAEKAAYSAATVVLAKADRLHSGPEDDARGYLKALKAFEDFQKQFPTSALASEVQFGMATCYEEMDQLERARELYQAIERQYPSPKVIQIKLIRLEQRMGKRGSEKGNKNPN